MGGTQRTKMPTSFGSGKQKTSGLHRLPCTKDTVLRAMAAERLLGEFGLYRAIPLRDVAIATARAIGVNQKLAAKLGTAMGGVIAELLSESAKVLVPNAVDLQVFHIPPQYKFVADHQGHTTKEDIVPTTFKHFVSVKKKLQRLLKAHEAGHQREVKRARVNVVKECWKDHRTRLREIREYKGFKTQVAVPVAEYVARTHQRNADTRMDSAKPKSQTIPTTSPSVIL